MIIIEPIGGLCNRMRAIISAYQYELKEDPEKRMIILWWKHDECNCRFGDIFFEDFGRDEGINVKVINLPYFGKGKIALRLRHFVKRIFTDFCKKKCDYVLELKGWNSIEIDSTLLKKLYVASYSDWYEYVQDYRVFRFQTSVLNQAKKVLDYTNEEYFGVHIRRTDNQVSIDHSPIELFESEIRKALNDGKVNRFFLATDELVVREKLIETFGSDRVIFNNDATLNRTTKEGIIDAAIDLILLSNGRFMIGSYYSSFSEIAAMLNGIELRTVYYEEKGIYKENRL